MTTNDVHPQPWLHHYPEGIDWSTTLTRRALNEYIDDAEIRFAARPLEPEAVVGQGLEPEPGDRSGRNTRLHLIIIHGCHLATDQQGVVRLWLELSSRP